MIIQFNTDHNIAGREAFETKITDLLTDGLSRISHQITRVEVHLSDENGHKNGFNDKKCLLEARLEGMQPIVASDHANNHELATKGAMNKLKTAIDSKIGQLKNH